MHEYPVTVQIVDIASETARKNKGRVRRIDLVVGEDSGFIGESIQMYFDVVAEGTLCEGAKLVIDSVSVLRWRREPDGNWERILCEKRGTGSGGRTCCGRRPCDLTVFFPNC